MFKKSTGLFCALALAFTTSVYAQADAALTAAVKTKLAADATVTASNINVSTDGQVVTLSGVVASKAEKDRALMVARGTTGVTSVVDKLTIKGTAAAPGGKTVADKAAGGVEKGADKSADAVGTAAKKTAGAADKTKDKVGGALEATGDAIGTAAKATGKAVGTAAKKTANAVGVGADKTKEATEKAADNTKRTAERAGDRTQDKVADADVDKAGAVVSDAAVTSAVKAKLLGDGKTPGLRIDVDTQDGVVTLSGNVATAAEQANALRLARNTRGVKRVVDKMTVAGR
jgi:osmotically-inducible protein OsmY